MKKSELKASIKNEIIDILEDVSQEDPKDIDARTTSIDSLTTSIDNLQKKMKEGNNQDDGYVNHTYNDSVIDKYNVPVEPTAVFEDDEDKEPTAAQLKKEPISKIGYKLADTQKEMKRVVKKWKDAEGSEKEKLTDRLRELTKIKKELESLLEIKK